MMCGSSRAFQKRMGLGVLEDVLGGLWRSVSLVDFLAGEAPADVSTPVGGCSRPPQEREIRKSRKGFPDFPKLGVLTVRG